MEQPGFSLHHIKEPDVMFGCSRSELEQLFILGALSGLALGLLGWLISGLWPLIVALPMLGMGGAVTIGAARMAAAKRGKPWGYFPHRLQLWQATKGLRPGAPFLSRSGSWDRRRHEVSV